MTLRVTSRQLGISVDFYRFAAHKTGLKTLIEKGREIPLGGDTDPQNPTWDSLLKGAVIKRDKQAITTEEMFSDHDLYLNYMCGGPGFGDPLDREPQSVFDDLNDGYLLELFADRVYGVVARKGGRRRVRRGRQRHRGETQGDPQGAHRRFGADLRMDEGRT